MGKLISLLMGGASLNPMTLLALGLGFLLFTGSVFGAGMYTESRMYAKAGATAVVVAAKAQEKHDVQMHNDAVAISHSFDASDAKHDAKVVTIVKTIHDIEPPQNNCVLSPDVAKLLNDAGHYDPAK